MVLPGQSSVHSSHDMLHPYSYTHSNGSKASNVSTDVHSTNDVAHVRGRHLGVAHPRPEGRPTSRAAARGISRVASRAPSRATSHSRTSRAPSRTPGPSVVDLSIMPPRSPGPAHPQLPSSPSSPDRQTIGSRQSVVLAGDIAEPTPDSLPSIAISLPVERETIYPTMTIPRYDNYATVSPDPGDWTLAPVATHLTIENVPLDWVACTHPEGRLYFYHPRRRIYTDCDVRESSTLATLITFARIIDEMVAEQGLVLPPNCELVLFLEERRISGGYNWIYYFVDHSSRSLFWVQECHPIDDLLIHEVTALNAPYDIKCEVEAKYWQHLEMYPYGHRIPDEVFTELTGMLLFASIDAITSMTTTVTYSKDEVHRMLGLVKSAKAVQGTDYATAAVGRLMGIWIHNRFLNFHGQTHARLGRDQSVYNNVKTRRTPLIRILAPFFWNAPEVHLRGLEKIWVDGIISIIPWGSFIGKLQNEWQEFVLYSTVLLNANVAFLAIPSVDSGNGHVTAAQISSYLSVVTSVGSILLGLLLIRQHRVKSKETAEEANRFLSSRKHEMLGLETLAIIYSLPYALLMWGMLTFLLAFSFECFGSNDRTAIFTTAAVWIAVALLVGWTIFTGWESGGDSSVWDILHRLWDRLFPAKEPGEEIATEAEEGRTTAAGNEKTKLARWWARRVRPPQALPHSGDPPSTAPTPASVPEIGSNV
ncbi:hypothetical protein DICSQDRAFT_157070 [Dichomitus squalens LYAD-421 SS1]|uniref:WW domain-containing protein n=1 Tax=Dichomitus squalens (strain LYAD-421) TaxID=732165 RepID=R7SSG3_DICSQ|nr:uncharacterized protein DICSQDRAFT_157070 [Dichomitus squalens LYAD-421 SS1]EJF57927.1 hypothetical protein DICSQDRAFT_157070 [Dichomitus squalens LYAD-421 SS1]